MSIALALGQLEEAIGMVEDAGNDATPGLYAALVRVRDFLLQAAAAEAARVPLTLESPITAEEVWRAAYRETQQ